MKSSKAWTMGSWMIAAAFVVSPVFADEAATAQESADAVAATVDAAADSVEEAVETVQEIGEELGITQEVAATQEDAATQPAEVQADGGDPMAAAMADWMANANPGEHHSKLDAYVGTWDVTTHYWMAPDAPPQVSSGTSKIKWILEGRFIVEKFSSSFAMPGMPPQDFKGMGLTGYDNAKGEYVATWSDTMSTALVTSSGQFDDSSQTLTLANSFDCPMDGPCQMRMTLTVVGPDELSMMAFKTPEGGEEAKVMEVIYNRQP